MSRYQKFMERSRNFSTKFKMQLMITFICTYTVILVVGCVWFYHKSVQIIKDRSKQDIHQQLQQLEYNLLLVTEEMESMAQSFVISNNVGRILNGYYASDSERISLTREIFDSISTIQMSYSYVDSIYFYGCGGTVLGGQANSRRYVTEALDTESFFASKLYQEAIQGDDIVLWTGGYTGNDFAFCMEEKRDRNYITLARKLNFVGLESALLVVNIDEEYFRKLYFGLDQDNAHERYLVSADGVIISHPDSARIGEVSSYYQELKESRWTGFSVNGEADDKVQIVGRELGNLGWVIIDETKLSYLEKDAQPLKGIMALIVVIGIAAAWGSSFFWIYRITKPLNYLNHMMYETEKGVFGLELDTKTTTQLGILGTQFNSMSVKIQNLIEENRRIEEEKRSYEIQTLWSQINPHFIYNTLNVIKWMSMIAKTDNITKCVMALGNILQPIFRRKGDYSKLKDEMDYIDNYITIMNFRYGNTIRYINKIPEEYYSQEVLSFILQPVVENCIVHGSSAGTKQILITVGLQSDEEVISLIVSDNGMGVEEDRIFELQEKLCKHCVSDEKDERHGIGMLNVNRRLFLYYGEEYGLTISNNIDGGARVVIKIPKNRKKIPES